MKRTIRVGIVQQACTNDLKLNLEKLHRNIATGCEKKTIFAAL